MSKKHLAIDGSQGEGGGQILRTALSLSVLTQTPVRIHRIRAGRPKPGLMRQHLACVRAAAVVAGADVEGAELNSTELRFNPHTIGSGSHHFSIGTAGSCNLVLQTLIPMLLRGAGKSRITVEGGTHNPLAPSSCYLERVFLPQLRRIGAKISLKVERVGLAPAGGGLIVLEIEPGPLLPMCIEERGEAQGIFAHSMVAAIAENVALREITAVADHYKLTRKAISHSVLEHLTGPGNVLSVWAQFANVTELITCHGARGSSAESIAARACRELDAWLHSEVVCAEHLADQLMLPLWLSGRGAFQCGGLSAHARTNLDVIALFDGPRLAVQVGVGGGQRISCQPT